MDFKKILVITAILLVLCVSLVAVSASTISLGRVTSYDVTQNGGSSSSMSAPFTLTVEIDLSNMDDDERASLESAIADDKLRLHCNFTFDAGNAEYNGVLDEDSVSIDGDKLTIVQEISMPVSSSKISLQDLAFDSSKDKFYATIQK